MKADLIGVHVCVKEERRILSLSLSLLLLMSTVRSQVIEMDIASIEFGDQPALRRAS